MDDAIRRGRDFLRSRHTGEASADRDAGVPPPPLVKGAAPGARAVDLPLFDAGLLVRPGLDAALRSRRSRRAFGRGPLALEQLGYVLWAAAGVHSLDAGLASSERTPASAGGRHPFELYVAARAVTGLSPGLYHHLALSEQLETLPAPVDLEGALDRALLEQDWTLRAAAVLVWSCVPYRSEWKYGRAAHRLMLLDAGHAGQNVYLAAEGLGLACCAAGGYDQGAMDRLLGLDGEEEMAVHVMGLGPV